MKKTRLASPVFYLNQDFLIGISYNKGMQANDKLKKYFSALVLGTMLALFFPFSFVTAETGRPQSTILNVPFIKQIPTGHRNDPRQKDGCEETSILMALAWARGGSIPPEEAERDIVNLSEYERVMFGFYQDTSIEDTAKLMQDYYGYTKLEVKQNINSENIKQELAQGNLVIIPVNTRLTRMRMYKNGPPRHTLVAVGYDDRDDTITVHDSAYGAFRTIPAAVLDRALSNYWSGNHRPDTNPGKAMLVVYR